MRRIVTAAQALGIISDEKAFGKNIETINPSVEPRFDDPKNSLGFLVRQLKDPENYRPARSVPDGADRTTYFNPQTGEWLRRHVNPVKGAPKPGARFTKKTAVSLLPKDGRMIFFPQKNGIVLVFNSEQCHVKQYIFDHNVRSNDRWWLRQPDPAKRTTALKRSTTLDAIRELQRDARRRNVTPLWNEILPGLSADAVIAVAVPKDNLIRRLNAQYRRLLIRRELKIDVPLLIMTQQADVHEYTKAMQLEDLMNAKKSDFGSIAREYYNAIIALDPTLEIDIFKAIRNRDIAMINLILTQHPEDSKKIQADKTPIQLAVELGYWDCVTAIATVVKTDANDSARYGHALFTAAFSNKTDVVITLINANASTGWSHTETGNCAVHYAVQHKNVAMCNAILDKNFGDLERKNKANQTPMQLAERLRYLDIADEISRRYGLRTKATPALSTSKSLIGQQTVVDRNTGRSEVIATFPRETLAAQEKKKAREELLQLQRDLIDQIRVLSSEIAPKDTNTKIPEFFKKIARELNGSTKKEEKKRALSAALQLINNQVRTEVAVSRAAEDAFNKVLLDNPRWKDGLRSKRTAQLIDRTLALINRGVVTEQPAVLQKSAAALQAPHQAGQMPARQSSSSQSRINVGLFATSTSAAQKKKGSKKQPVPKTH